MKLTTARYYTPKGRSIQAKGITPDIEVQQEIPQEIKDKITAMLAVRRLGVAEDIAAAVSYVSSDDAGYLTGQVLAIDGGMTMC